MKVINQSFALNNGIMIPKLGFGTSPLKGDDAYQAVLTALKNGYRHIDTAALYDNEDAVGRAIKDSGINRSALFVTSKLESSIKTYQGALDAFNVTMEKLGLEVLDLYLIHAPWPWSDKGSNHDHGNVQAYKALEKLYLDGRIKAIGVSNFSPKDLDNILSHCTIVPAVNQMAYFIGYRQQETIDYCLQKNIQITAYSPLGKGKLLTNQSLLDIAKKYDVTPAQIALKYIIQKNIAPLPRSKTPHNILNNTQLDFNLRNEDILVLDYIQEDPR